MVTSRGGMLKLNVLELRRCRRGRRRAGQRGTPVTEVASFDRGETGVGLAARTAPARAWSMGTAEGVVKRVLPELPARTGRVRVSR